jgi:hypothetical protein
MTVCDVDVGQVSFARFDPINELLILLDGEESIDQHCVALPVDQCRSVRHPLQVFLAGRQVASKAGSTYTGSHTAVLKPYPS